MRWGARGLVLARKISHNNMGHGESQIGYLANYINLYDGHAPGLH